MKSLNYLSLLVIAALTISCDSSTDSSDNSTGSLSLNITDAPIDDAFSVVVQFSEVQLKGEEEDQNLSFVFEEPKSINLLELQGSESEALFLNEVVPAGVYNEVRLIVNAEPGVEDTYIVLNEGGAQHDMTVPSGSQSGLKVNGAFTVPINGASNFTIDFDVRKSIVKSGNVNSANGIKYHLKPVLRIVDNSMVGHISGTIDPELLTQGAGCSDDDVDSHNAVYVYSGAGIEADDIDEDEASVDPITTALVGYISDTDSHTYEVGFLLAGAYTISFTCNADAEITSEDNDLQFTGTQDVEVLVNETSSADFAPAVI
jgi:hypothetical protein